MLEAHLFYVRVGCQHANGVHAPHLVVCKFKSDGATHRQICCEALPLRRQPAGRSLTQLVSNEGWLGLDQPHVWYIALFMGKTKALQPTYGYATDYKKSVHAKMLFLTFMVF